MTLGHRLKVISSICKRIVAERKYPPRRILIVVLKDQFRVR